MTSSSLWRPLPQAGEAWNQSWKRLRTRCSGHRHEVPEYAGPLRERSPRLRRCDRALHRFVSRCAGPDQREAGAAPILRWPAGVPRGRTWMPPAAYASGKGGVAPLRRRATRRLLPGDDDGAGRVDLRLHRRALLESVEGYASPASMRASANGGGAGRRPACRTAGEVDLPALAAAAGWRLPKRAAVLVCATGPAGDRRRWAEVLHASTGASGASSSGRRGPGRAARSAGRPRRPCGCRPSRSSGSLRDPGASPPAPVGGGLQTLVIAMSISQSCSWPRAPGHRAIVQLRLSLWRPHARGEGAHAANGSGFVQRQGNASAMAIALDVHPRRRATGSRLRELLAISSMTRGSVRARGGLRTACTATA